MQDSDLVKYRSNFDQQPSVFHLRICMISGMGFFVPMILVRKYRRPWMDGDGDVTLCERQ